MPKKTSENNEFLLRDLLIATKHERLVDILLSLHSSNTNFQKQLDIIFAGLEEDPKKIISMIKKEISALKKSTKFVDYYEAGSLEKRLDDLRLRIVNDLSDRSVKIAFEMMLDFLELQKNTLERVDDSNGSVSDVFIAACEDLGSLAENTNHLNIQEIVEIVFERFINNNYGIYDAIIHHFKDSLKSHGLDLLQERFESIANENNISKIKRGLKSIADCKNDVDLFIRVCSFKVEMCAHDHLEIAKRLLNHWRAREALKWLDTMEIPINYSWQHDRKELKIQALELDGQYEHAQNERIAWFEESLSVKLYKEILKVSKHDFKEAFQSDTITKAFQFPEPHTALHFLIQIQAFEEAARFVRIRFNELNGKQYYTLRPAADLLKNNDPIAATLLYRKMIDLILDDTKSKYYNYAAKDLVICSILDTKIKTWEDVQKHDDYFKQIENKHKRKVRFWSEYTLALQKQRAKEVKVG